MMASLTIHIDSTPPVDQATATHATIIEKCRTRYTDLENLLSGCLTAASIPHEFASASHEVTLGDGEAEFRMCVTVPDHKQQQAHTVLLHETNLVTVTQITTDRQPSLDTPSQPTP